MKKVKKSYVKPVVEKVEHLDFPGTDPADDIEGKYTCCGTGWNVGISGKCGRSVDDFKDASSRKQMGQ